MADYFDAVVGLLEKMLKRLSALEFAIGSKEPDGDTGLTMLERIKWLEVRCDRLEQRLPEPTTKDGRVDGTKLAPGTPGWVR